MAAELLTTFFKDKENEGHGDFTVIANLRN